MFTSLRLLFYATFVLCFSFIKTVDGARILAVFPFPGPSQYILVQPYLKALAARGHQVTAITGFPQKQPVNNFRDVLVTEVFDNYEELVNGAKIKRNKWDDMTFYVRSFSKYCEIIIKNPGVQKLLKEGQFDVVIVEALYIDACYSFGRHFNAPIIGLSSFGTDPIIDELMGNMSPLSYVPVVTSGLIDRMTYAERLRNVLLTFLELLHIRLVHLPEQQKVLRTYMPHIKEDVWELRTNFSLMLLNQHFSLSFPHPYVPNMVEIGGFQINYQPKPLPSELLDFINNSTEDVVYFSMGSNIKSKDFPPEKLRTICEVFASLPYKFVWKFENPILSGKPNNVFISSWFPQTDVLAHPRVKLFISHGGLLSTSESVYHGKPMLGLPVFYDQHLNIRKAVQNGFALSLNFAELPRDEFNSSILEMMSNPKYINNAKAMSTLYHDQPMKPLDLAIFWTEYVLRHRGAVHLQNTAQKMNFIQKHSIDTVGVLIVAFVLANLLLIYAVFKIVKFMFVRKSSKEKIN